MASHGLERRARASSLDVSPQFNRLLVPFRISTEVSVSETTVSLLEDNHRDIP